MPTYLVRWPNGLVSIATADDMKDLSLELAKDEVCTEHLYAVMKVPYKTKKAALAAAKEAMAKERQGLK